MSNSENPASIIISHLHLVVVSGLYTMRNILFWGSGEMMHPNRQPKWIHGTQGLHNSVHLWIAALPHSLWRLKCSYFLKSSSVLHLQPPFVLLVVSTILFENASTSHNRSMWAFPYITTETETSLYGGLYACPSLYWSHLLWLRPYD